MRTRTVLLIGGPLDETWQQVDGDRLEVMKQPRIIDGPIGPIGPAFEIITYSRAGLWSLGGKAPWVEVWTPGGESPESWGDVPPGWAAAKGRRES